MSYDVRVLNMAKGSCLSLWPAKLLKIAYLEEDFDNISSRKKINKLANLIDLSQQDNKKSLTSTITNLIDHLVKGQSYFTVWDKH